MSSKLSDGAGSVAEVATIGASVSFVCAAFCFKSGIKASL
jgi:hypothetical protein